MEEKQEQKKKKILKILKIIIYSLIGIIIVLIGIASCKKTKALEPYPNYDYQYIGQLLYRNDYDNNYYIDDYRILYYYNGSEWIKGSGNYDNNYDIHTQKVLDTSDGLGISNANVELNQIYLIKWTFSNYTYNIYAMTTITIYERELTTELYNNGYEVAADDNSQGNINGAYEQGRQAGKNEVQNQYNQALEQATKQYQEGINTLNDEIDRLETQLNSNAPAWGSFKSLLSLIVTYPVQLFKEGLDIEIFGVNVGHFILGIGILLILMTIIAGVLHGKVGGGKE